MVLKTLLLSGLPDDDKSHIIYIAGGAASTLLLLCFVIVKPVFRKTFNDYFIEYYCNSMPLGTCRAYYGKVHTLLSGA